MLKIKRKEIIGKQWAANEQHSFCCTARRVQSNEQHSRCNQMTVHFGHLAQVHSNVRMEHSASVGDRSQAGKYFQLPPLQKHSECNGSDWVVPSPVDSLSFGIQKSSFSMLLLFELGNSTNCKTELLAAVVVLDSAQTVEDMSSVSGKQNHCTVSSHSAVLIPSAELSRSSVASVVHIEKSSVSLCVPNSLFQFAVFLLFPTFTRTREVSSNLVN